MPIEYSLDNRKFRLSYKELKSKYDEFCEMDDDQFLQILPQAIHLACIISFLKETPSYICLSDTGLIHELIHLLPDNETTTPLREIRTLFQTSLKLS